LAQATLCIMLDGDPAPLPKKGRGQSPQIIVDLCLLWPSGWMGQDASWYEIGLGPCHIVLDGDPAPLSKKGTQPPIVDLCMLWPSGWMGQDASWYEIGLGPGHIVLDGDPAPPPQKGHILGPCLSWPNGWMDEDATWHESRPRRQATLCDIGTQLPQKHDTKDIPQVIEG